MASSPQLVQLGSGPNSGQGDNLYTAFTKINQNFNDIYGGTVSINNSGLLTTFQSIYNAGTTTIVVAVLNQATPYINALVGSVAITTQTSSLIITGNTQSVSSTTGVLQVAGGAGIQGNLYVGGAIYQNGVQVGTGSGTAASGTGTTTTFVISNTTPTASTYTGALVVAGGAGIAGALNVGGNVYANAYFSNGVPINNIYWNGGAITSTLYVNNFTVASNTSSGALQVSGGAGIGGNLYVGGGITATNLTINNTFIALGGGASATSNGVSIGYQAGSGGNNAFATSIGFSAGSLLPSTGTVNVGFNAGYSSQATNAIAIGNQAGRSNQGANAIAIGSGAGAANQPANSIVLNASGVDIARANAGLYISPVRADASSSGTTWSVFYNPTTQELTTSSLYNLPTLTVNALTVGSVLTSNASAVNIFPTSQSILVGSLSGNNYITLSNNVNITPSTITLNASNGIYTSPTTGIVQQLFTNYGVRVGPVSYYNSTTSVCTISNTCTYFLIDNGTTSSLTLYMPTNPVVGQTIQISTNKTIGITQLATSGTYISGALTSTFVAGTSGKWVYYYSSGTVTTSTWFRV
jgi:hypothetical protein